MISQILAQVSAPELTSLGPPSQATAFTPPGFASLITTFFDGFALLHTYTFVAVQYHTMNIIHIMLYVLM